MGRGGGGEEEEEEEEVSDETPLTRQTKQSACHWADKAEM